MKKVISVLLCILVFIPIFAMSSYAFQAYSVPNDFIKGFVYKIDDKAFFSTNEAITELFETKETTVYLPMECVGKTVEVKIIFNYSANKDVSGNTVIVPGTSWVDIFLSEDTEAVRYSVNFVCSEKSQYDFERQIGSSDTVGFLGYYINDRVVFLSQDEIDTALNKGIAYVWDRNFKIEAAYPEEFNFIMDFESAGSGSYSGKRVTYEWKNSEGEKCKIYVSRYMSVLDEEFWAMMKGIFRAFFEFFFKLI